MIGMLNIYHLCHDLGGGNDCEMISFWQHGHDKRHTILLMQ